jgi:hypothetical protein
VLNPHGGQLLPAADDPFFGAGQESSQPQLMSYAQLRWNEYAGNQAARKLVAAMTEDLFRGRIQGNDAPLVVHDHHAVQSGFHKGMKALVGCRKAKPSHSEYYRLVRSIVQDHGHLRFTGSIMALTLEAFWAK